MPISLSPPCDVDDRSAVIHVVAYPAHGNYYSLGASFQSTLWLICFWWEGPFGIVEPNGIGPPYWLMESFPNHGSVGLWFCQVGSHSYNVVILNYLSVHKPTTNYTSESFNFKLHEAYICTFCTKTACQTCTKSCLVHVPNILHLWWWWWLTGCTFKNYWYL